MKYVYILIFAFILSAYSNSFAETVMEADSDAIQIKTLKEKIDDISDRENAIEIKTNKIEGSLVSLGNSVNNISIARLKSSSVTKLGAFILLSGLLVMYYLLGQSYNQSRADKFKIIVTNMKRNLVPTLGARCSICSKKVMLDDARVFWNQEPNSEKYPYLHTPYKMHLGHENCLLSSGLYVQPRKTHKDLKDIEIHKCSIPEFLLLVPQMKKWWDEYRVHWAKRRDSKERLNYHHHLPRPIDPGTVQAFTGVRPLHFCGARFTGYYAVC